MTQDVALSILKTGANAFLTGEPGAGKTHTVNTYVAWLASHGITPAITASTGIAATHLGGSTIHSWSGIGINTNMSSRDAEYLLENAKVVKRLNETPVLLIDEISMLDARTLDTVDLVCRTVRRNQAPFGGMQVVFVGDFFQLPPVSRMGELPAKFAFHARGWQEANPTVCYLSEQHRQADGRFLDLLASLRRGRVTEEGRSLLASRQVVPSGEVLHTQLSAHNLDVDRVNQMHLAQLPGDIHVFEMLSKGAEKLVLSLKKNCLSPERLVLKIGARVMFTKNHPEGKFVNGTLGEVVSFDAETDAPTIRTSDGRDIEPSPMEWALMDGSHILAKINQLPLRLAWAMTVHKSQGMTLDAAHIDLSRAFEFGQGYVALSRVRSAEGLFLAGWNERALQVHPEILTTDVAFRGRSAYAEEQVGKRSLGEQAELEKKFIAQSGGSWEPVAAASVALKPRKKKASATKVPTQEETHALFLQGKTVDEIAEVRGLVATTIWGHLEKLFMDGAITRDDIQRLVPPSLAPAIPKIQAAFKASGDGRLMPMFEKFEKRYTFGELRLARMLME